MDSLADQSIAQSSKNEDASLRLNSEIYGIVPPYLWEEMKKHNPGIAAYKDTFDQMQQNDPQGIFLNRINSSGGDSAREVYDARGKFLSANEKGTKSRFEGEPPSGNPEVDDVYNFTGKVRDFYKQVFGRNSIDDNGMKVISRINYGRNFENAYWDGDKMTFGRPDASSPFQRFTLQDITGHEIAHGVTQHESGLQPFGQAGALDESISDVFGQLVEQWSLRQKARDANWVVGEGIWKPSVRGRGIRDMLRPGTAYDDPIVGKDPQPARMADYVKTFEDNGGVHINSGIPNRAFAEFAVAVGGYAWEKPGQIWYKAAQLAGSNPSFAQFAQATINAAQNLGYAGVIDKLKTAWSNVGVIPSEKQVDDLTPGGGEWFSMSKKSPQHS